MLLLADLGFPNRLIGKVMFSGDEVSLLRKGERHLSVIVWCSGSGEGSLVCQWGRKEPAEDGNHPQCVFRRLRPLACLSRPVGLFLFWEETHKVRERFCSEVTMWKNHSSISPSVEG